MLRTARMSVPYAKTVVIKQILFSGKFSQGDLLQMLIKQKSCIWLTVKMLNEGWPWDLLIMKIVSYIH